MCINCLPLEMLEDWTASYRPDLLTFVPYEWAFNIMLRDFEMVWSANEHNYLECTSNKQEMGQFSMNNSNLCLYIYWQLLWYIKLVLHTSWNIYSMLREGFCSLKIDSCFHSFCCYFSSWISLLWWTVWTNICSSVSTLFAWSWRNQVLSSGVNNNTLMVLYILTYILILQEFSCIKWIVSWEKESF